MSIFSLLTARFKLAGGWTLVKGNGYVITKVDIELLRERWMRPWRGPPRCTAGKTRGPRRNIIT
jgi:hypothetical protein